MTWDKRFLALAEHVAGWSKDPSTQVGAVIVDGDRRIVSIGYNGLPREVSDRPERLDNREIKYEMTVHAEANAILFAQRDLSGCTIYTWPLPPCSRCAALIIQTNIGKVVSPPAPERWQTSCALARQMFGEAAVVCEEI